jgi:predicted dienelactone hydrolase
MFVGEQTMKKLFLILLLIGLGMALFPHSLNAHGTPQPRYAAWGPYAVGTREVVIPNGDRPMNATLWYPAVQTEGHEAGMTYHYLMIETQGQALSDADPDLSGGPYPLVIYAHGIGLYRTVATYMTEQIASYGFVVLAADFPGSSLQDAMQQVDPATLQGVLSGQISGQQLIASWHTPEALTLGTAYRPLDILAEINFAETLTAEGASLEGMIDTDTVALVGHSFGGYAVLAAGGARLDFDAFNAWCDDPNGLHFVPDMDPMFSPSDVSSGSPLGCQIRDRAADIAQYRGMADVPSGLWPATTDPRIKAVVAEAPANATIFGSEGLAALDMPILVQVGSSDTSTPPERDVYPVYTNVGSSDKALVVYTGGEHSLFMNALEQFDLNPGVDLEAAHALNNHFTVAFLLTTLKDDAEAAAALNPESVDFAGIQYTTTLR